MTGRSDDESTSWNTALDEELGAANIMINEGKRGGRYENVLYAARSMYLHLFHFIRVQLFLDTLRQRRCQPTPCGRFTTAVINGSRESVINREIRGECQSLRR